MKYNFVAYGSLMSHQSLRQSIPDKHFSPVIVKNYKRIFNLATEKSKYPDVLNIVKSKDSKFNGVLFQLNKKELKKVKEREPEYNLEETYAYDFLTGKRLCKCLVVIDRYIAIDKKHKPNKKYFTLCREAAYHISREFGEFWDNTTYTSTGKKISEWVKYNKDYDTIN